jgi:hypothetical protein
VMDLHHLLLAGLPAHSGLPLKADIAQYGRHFAFVLKAAIPKHNGSATSDNI